MGWGAPSNGPRPAGSGRRPGPEGPRARRRQAGGELLEPLLDFELEAVGQLARRRPSPRESRARTSSSRACTSPFLRPRNSVRSSSRPRASRTRPASSANRRRAAATRSANGVMAASDEGLFGLNGDRGESRGRADGQLGQDLPVEQDRRPSSGRGRSGCRTGRSPRPRR